MTTAKFWGRSLLLTRTRRPHRQEYKALVFLTDGTILTVELARRGR